MTVRSRTFQQLSPHLLAIPGWARHRPGQQQAKVGSAGMDGQEGEPDRRLSLGVQTHPSADKATETGTHQYTMALGGMSASLSMAFKTTSL